MITPSNYLRTLPCGDVVSFRDLCDVFPTGQAAQALHVAVKGGILATTADARYRRTALRAVPHQRTHAQRTTDRAARQARLRTRNYRGAVAAQARRDALRGR